MAFEGLTFAVDPGGKSSGAYTILDAQEGGQLLKSGHLPQEPREWKQLFDNFYPHIPVRAWIEQVGTRPGDRPSQAATLVGSFMMAWTALYFRKNTSVHLVRPQVWQHHFKVGGYANYEARKKALHEAARVYYSSIPKYAADAALIARYGYERG